MHHSDDYAFFILDLPELDIDCEHPGVILTANCITLGRLAIVVRHHGGAAHFGPAEGNEISVDDILRGNRVMELLRAELDAAVAANTTTFVSFSAN